jgi:hypothetical protein
LASYQGCELCTIAGARHAYVSGQIDADELERRIDVCLRDAERP